MKRLKYALTFLSLVGLLSIPQFLNYLGFEPFIYSSYSEIYNEFQQNLNHHLTSLWTTFYYGFIAITISVIAGIGIGLIIAYFDKWLGFFENTLKFIWSLPLIAVAVFLHLINIPEFTYTIITGVFLGIFPIVSFTFRKCIEKDDRINSLVASFNLTKMQEFIYFRFPEVLRNLSIPLAQSVPLTYIGITMGEYTIGGVIDSTYFGLGSDFRSAMDKSLFPKVYVSMFLMMVLVFSSGIIFDEFTKVKYYIFEVKSKVRSLLLKIKFTLFKEEIK